MNIGYKKIWVKKSFCYKNSCDQLLFGPNSPRQMSPGQMGPEQMDLGSSNFCEFSLNARERERESLFSDIAYTKIFSGSTTLYMQKFTASSVVNKLYATYMPIELELV